MEWSPYQFLLPPTACFPKNTAKDVILCHFVTPVSRIARTANANAIPRFVNQPNQRYDPVCECQLTN
jgi:hypothetical protein